MTITTFKFFGVNNESADFESDSFNVYQGIAENEPDLYYCTAVLTDESTVDLSHYPANPFEYCGCDFFTVEVIEWNNNWSSNLPSELFDNLDDAKDYANKANRFEIEQIGNNSFVNNGVQCIVKDKDGKFVYEPEPLRENEYADDYTGDSFFVAPTIKIEDEYYDVEFPVRANRVGDIKYIHLTNGDVLRHHVWCSAFDLKKANGDLICNVKVNLG